MYAKTTTTTTIIITKDIFVEVFLVIFILSLSVFINETSATAGYCYQCNSRNPKCGINVTAELKIDGTPCNGQCYTRLNRDDEFTIYRGCSWEHGFMTEQRRNLLIIQGNSVWVFCDTPYCNFEATNLFTTVCYQPICDYLNFPQDCKLPNADVTCGRNCSNKLCNSIVVPNRNRNRKRHPSHVRNHTSFVIISDEIGRNEVTAIADRANANAEVDGLVSRGGAAEAGGDASPNEDVSSGEAFFLEVIFGHHHYQTQMHLTHQQHVVHKINT
ncbi:unnamed protein product [Rotaria magnacalcarata]|uniref:Uncharacterized protein n=2 Tax=Rotaria magnacalcarata TaxID=392030 RepID=A0A819G0C8_9BILA|nr:unnamed protein product [Rotaria magnacalcarata]CAF3877579.1 unnamed protein product [Rotaria magnacalcarata]